ncbi:hypothetical protein VRQ87_000053 [Morganella morganii]|nr:hypothetical protein [Morganella morganii]
MINAEFTKESRDITIAFLEEKINICIAKLYILDQSDPKLRKEIDDIENNLEKIKKTLDIIKNK